MSDELKTLRAVNETDVEWEDTRFDDCFVKVLHFGDGVNFELDKFEPGAHTFAHAHGFWQMRYVLEGEFIVNGTPHGPGTLIQFPPLDKYEVFSPEGGTWIILQLPNAETGEKPKDPTGKAYGGDPAGKS